MAVQFIDLGGASNTLTLGDDDFIIIGTDGDNTLTLGNGNDKLTLGNGNNTLTLGGGTNRIKAGVGDNTITINGLGSVKVTGAKVWVGSFARGKLRDPIGDSETVSVGPPIRRDGAAL